MNVEILQFILAKGAGEAALRRLAKYFVSEGETATKRLYFDSREIEAALGLQRKVAENILKARDEAIALLKQIEGSKVEIVWLGSDRYPHRIRQILGDEAPPVLFLKGNLGLLDMKSVGFCGSRKASEKGIEITSRCAEQLVEKSYCIVSGYASGVDMSAHKSAITHGGKTIFVLAEGILCFREKQELRGAINEENSLVVSQFPPSLAWIARNAMKRNPTIIGLSDAMILVESGLNGGTFAAGKESLRLRHPLFVIDYKSPGPSAVANSYFIYNGGIPIRGKQDGTPNLEKLFKATTKPRSDRDKPQTLLDLMTASPC
ncbi:MAG: hypothetical protein GMKNLPBB_02734 [Myxococcota bacterium]|nr:hypothetical protein [Myxococcota bacterium]